MKTTIRSRARAIRDEAITRITGRSAITGQPAQAYHLGPYRVVRQLHRDTPASLLVCKGREQLVTITAAGSVIPEATAYESKIAVANLITTLETYVAIGSWTVAR